MFVTLLLGCCVEQRHARFRRILPYIFTLFKSFVQQFLACLCGDTQRRATEWKLAEQARQNRKAKRIAQVRSSHSPSNPKWSCIFYGSRVGLFAWGFAFICLIAFLFLLLAWACSGFLTTWHPLNCFVVVQSHCYLLSKKNTAVSRPYCLQWMPAVFGLEPKLTGKKKFAPKLPFRTPDSRNPGALVRGSLWGHCEARKVVLHRIGQDLAQSSHLNTGLRRCFE